METDICFPAQVEFAGIHISVSCVGGIRLAPAVLAEIPHSLYNRMILDTYAKITDVTEELRRTSGAELWAIRLYIANSARSGLMRCGGRMRLLQL